MYVGRCLKKDLFRIGISLSPPLVSLLPAVPILASNPIGDTVDGLATSRGAPRYETLDTGPNDKATPRPVLVRCEGLKNNLDKYVDANLTVSPLAAILQKLPRGIISMKQARTKDHPQITSKAVHLMTTMNVSRYGAHGTSRYRTVE
jgi:hypothetical protein